MIFIGLILHWLEMNKSTVFGNQALSYHLTAVCDKVQQFEWPHRAYTVWKFHCGENCCVILSGNVEERLVCKGAVVAPGMKSNMDTIFDVIARANVEAPALNFSEREIRFAYYYEKNVVPEKIHKKLTIRWVFDLLGWLFAHGFSPQSSTYAPYLFCTIFHW